MQTITKVKKATSVINQQLAKEKDFERLLERLTILKTSNVHLLLFKQQDYKLLQTRESNKRAFTKPYIGHQKNIHESMNLLGITSGIAVTIEDCKFYVAEGMNRTLASMNDKKEIIAFVSKANFSDTFTNMNLHQKRLTKTELIDHCSKEGCNLKDYETLKNVIAQHRKIAKQSHKMNVIQPCLLELLLSGKSRVEAKKMIETKSFETSQVLIAQTKKITQQIYDLQNVGLPNGTRMNEGIINLILEKGEDYNHDLFVSRVKKSTIVEEKNAKLNTNNLRAIHDKKIANN